MNPHWHTKSVEGQLSRCDRKADRPYQLLRKFNPFHRNNRRQRRRKMRKVLVRITKCDNTQWQFLNQLYGPGWE